MKIELDKESILSSNLGHIPYKELEKLTRAMNKLLRIFHFPQNFLPIEIRLAKGRKIQYELYTEDKKIEYANLSTGQKTQLSICWRIGLNYSLAYLIPHRILMFDDITTSLDMAQILPIAYILRKMAYTEDKESHRQVILTSHNEDLTNKLIDYLMPPSGKRLKVISFNEWTLDNGPKYTVYDINPNQPHQDKEIIINELEELMKS